MNTFLYIIIILILLEGIQLNFINIPFFTYIDEIFVVICFILGIRRILKEKKISHVISQLLICLFIFTAVGVISYYVNSQFNLKNLIMSSFLAIKFWLLIIGIENLRVKDNLKNTIINAILFIEKIAIVLGVVNFLFPDIYFTFFTFKESFIRFGFQAVTSCFNHPATFGWFMIVCAFIHFSLSYTKDSKSEKIKGVISIIFSILSLRTKIFVTIIVSCLFYVFMINRKNLKKLLRGALVAILFSIVITFSFRNIIINTYNLYFKGEQGTTARAALTDTGFQILKDYAPLGVGFGKFGTWYAALDYSEYYYKYKLNNIYGLNPYDPKYSTDTFWPAIAGETGIVGFICYIMMIYFCFTGLWKVYKVKKEEKSIDFIFVIVSIFTLLQAIVESFGEASFNTSPKNIITALFIGISLSLINNKNNEKQKKAE